jgi:hypothetical protein
VVFASLSLVTRHIARPKGQRFYRE